MSNWLITGCSTGLGRTLAQAVLAHGDNVAVTARDADAVGDIAGAHPDRARCYPGCGSGAAARS